MKYLTVLSLNTIIFLIFSGNILWGAELSEKTPVASISIGGEYSSGSYNTGSPTRSFYLPLIVGWYPSERLDMSLELPFLYQSSSQVTTSIYQATAVPTTSQSVARRGGSGGTDGSGGGGGSGNPGVYGLGDIILRAGYVPLLESNSMPQIRTSLVVKTPTASVSDGLGTGEFDFGGGFDLSKWFGSLHLAGETLYTYQGKVSGFGLKNYFSYSGTVGYQLSQSIQPMIIIKGATAPSSNSDDLLEARGRLLWTLTPATAVDLFVSGGISKSSPDYAGGIAVIYSF
jgi:hypothetical protein